MSNFKSAVQQLLKEHEALVNQKKCAQKAGERYLYLL